VGGAREKGSGEVRREGGEEREGEREEREEPGEEEGGGGGGGGGARGDGERGGRGEGGEGEERTRPSTPGVERWRKGRAVGERGFEAREGKLRGRERKQAESSWSREQREHEG